MAWLWRARWALGPRLRRAGAALWVGGAARAPESVERGTVVPVAAEPATLGSFTAVVHAADTWARTLRRPSLALVTGGPGQPNALAGIATPQCSGGPLP